MREQVAFAMFLSCYIACVTPATAQVFGTLPSRASSEIASECFAAERTFHAVYQETVNTWTEPQILDGEGKRAVPQHLQSPVNQESQSASEQHPFNKAFDAWLRATSYYRDEMHVPFEYDFEGVIPTAKAILNVEQLNAAGRVYIKHNCAAIFRAQDRDLTKMVRADEWTPPSTSTKVFGVEHMPVFGANVSLDPKDPEVSIAPMLGYSYADNRIAVAISLNIDVEAANLEEKDAFKYQPDTKGSAVGFAFGFYPWRWNGRHAIGGALTLNLGVKRFEEEAGEPEDYFAFRSFLGPQYVYHPPELNNNAIVFRIGWAQFFYGNILGCVSESGALETMVAIQTGPISPFVKLNFSSEKVYESGLSLVQLGVEILPQL